MQLYYNTDRIHIMGFRIVNITKKTVRRTWMDQTIIIVGTAELKDRAENAQLSILERIR